MLNKCDTVSVSVALLHRTHLLSVFIPKAAIRSFVSRRSFRASHREKEHFGMLRWCQIALSQSGGTTTLRMEFQTTASLTSFPPWLFHNTLSLLQILILHTLFRKAITSVWLDLGRCQAPLCKKFFTMSIFVESTIDMIDLLNCRSKGMFSTQGSCQSRNWELIPTL